MLIIAQTSGPKKNNFCLVSCTAWRAPASLVPVGALSDHGLVYFIFHCNNHVTSFFTWHWELRFDVAPELGLLRGLSCGVRSFDEGSGSLAMRSVQYRRVLPQWQCSIERIPPRRLARPISQACAGIAVQPAASVLVPWRAHLQQMLQKIRASRTPRASSRVSHAKQLFKNK